MSLKFGKAIKAFRITRENSIYDLLDQDTVDRLYDHVTNPKNTRKSAGSFSLPDFRMQIPLEPTYGKSSVRCLRIRPKGRNARQIYTGLIWTALFGSKKFTMIHWYILYSLFEKHLMKDKKSLALLRILRTTTERSGIAWNQKLKPVKTIVQNVLGKEEAVRYCLKIADDLGIKLPDKDPGVNNLLRVEPGFFTQRKPAEPNRVGVGYKDKGTLPKGPKEDTECSEDYLVHVGDLFADLLGQTQETQMFVSSYDPKKQQKLLPKFKEYLKSK